MPQSIASALCRLTNSVSNRWDYPALNVRNQFINPLHIHRFAEQNYLSEVALEFTERSKILTPSNIAGDRADTKLRAS